MELRGRITPILIATGIIWLCAAAVWLAIDLDIVRAAAAILAIFAMIVIWPMWALNEYGLNVDGTAQDAQHEKAKRDTDQPDDARISLLLALLTPDQRVDLATRLMDELDTEGEIVSLADLLTDSESRPTRAL